MLDNGRDSVPVYNICGLGTTNAGRSFAVHIALINGGFARIADAGYSAFGHFHNIWFL